MTTSLFDQATFNERLFFPRKESTRALGKAVDFFVPVRGARLHVRWHPKEKKTPTCLLFHGNGEVVSDYDDLAPFFADAGASLAVADYRGYGQSTGVPTLRSALEDAGPVLEAVCRHCKGPVVIHGRSLGALCAAPLLEMPFPEVRGLIWDSGLVKLPGLVARRGLPVPDVFPEEDLAFFDPLRKLAQWQLPLLVIHGAQDSHILPIEAEEAWRAAPTTDKTLTLLEGCDHNDLFASAAYWQALKAFFQKLPK